VTQTSTPPALHELERELARKHLLDRERSGKTDYYRPAYTREHYNDLCARAAVESALEAFGSAAVAHMARQMAHLDPDRRRALEGLADED
jgi:predicted transcriptional regulator